MIVLKESVALVTGGNRGLGRSFVKKLLEKGVSKVYATSRKPQEFEDDKVINILFDVTDSYSVSKLAALVPDVALVINNAGILGGSILGSNMQDIRNVFETNVFGPVEVIKTLAPILKQNGGGAIINVMSVGSWIPFGSYGASKAALWSLSNALRGELKGQGTQVTGLHVSFIDTDMVKDVNAEKSDPDAVAAAALEAAERGDSELLFDGVAEYAKSLASGPVDDLHF